MLSRAINDLYHLRRVHGVIPDHNLGLSISDKLQRLNLKPALAVLPHLRAVDMAEGALSTGVSVFTSSTPAHATNSRGGGLPQPVQKQLVFTTAAAAVAGKQVLPDPLSLCQLLECLAYAELAQCDVTRDALTLMKAYLPAMTGPQLARALAAVCALGEQDTRVPTLALLRAALSGSPDPSEGSARVAAPASPTGPPTPLRTLSPVSAHAATAAPPAGVDVIQLMEALQAAGVHQEEVWSTAAEHCVRHMDSFDGRELFRVMELLYLEDVRYYPDVFAATESYLSAQPYTFMSAPHRQRLVEYYRELGQPVTSLLAASSSGVADSLDAALAALPAPHTRRLQAPRDPRFTRARASSGAGGEATAASPATGSVDKGGALSTARSTEEREGRGPTVVPPVSAVMDAFVETAVAAVRGADTPALLEVLRKCEARAAMDARVMDAVVVRLAELCFPPAAAQRQPALDSLVLIQLLRAVLAFDEPAYFHGDPATARTLSTVLDALAQHSLQTVHGRLLPVAVAAVAVLPPPPRRAAGVAVAAPFPAQFYTAVVRYLRSNRDTLASEGPGRLLDIATVLSALPTFGGHEVLQEAYMGFIPAAATRAPLGMQVAFVPLLAALPAARAEVLPSVYRVIQSQKGWAARMSPEEARTLLQAMTHARTRDAGLLEGVAALVQQRRASLEPVELVWFMHALARLGLRELEFFSATAEFLLSAVSPTTRTRASVHDLCETLYVFTFVLQGVIRVVQQVMARLKVSANQANARDITLALYSFVRMQVGRHQDVTGPLCDRAVNIFDTFKGEELASTLSSMRALGYYHEGLVRTAAALVAHEAAARLQRQQTQRGVAGTDGLRAAPALRLTDTQFISVVAAIASLVHTSVARRQGNLKRNSLTVGVVPSAASTSDMAEAEAGGDPRTPVLATPPPSLEEAVEEAMERCFAALPTSVATTSADPGARASLRAGRRALTEVADALWAAGMAQVCESMTATGAIAPSEPPSPQGQPVPPSPPQRTRLSGVQLYLLTTTLATLRGYLSQPPSTAEWAALAVYVDAHSDKLARSPADVEGVAAAEVLAALAELRAVAVPALPSDEARLAAAVALADQWESSVEGLGSMPPRLLRCVQRDLTVVLAAAGVRDRLRRAGLPRALTSGPTLGGGTGLDTLSGATLVGEGRGRRGGGGRGAGRGRGRRTPPAAGTGKRLTVESVMAAMDAEAQGAGGRVGVAHLLPTGSSLAGLHRTDRGVFAPVSVASVPTEEWSPEDLTPALPGVSVGEAMGGGKESAPPPLVKGKAKIKSTARARKKAPV